MMPNIPCYELYGHQKHQVFNSDTTCFYVSNDHVAQMSWHSELLCLIIQCNVESYGLFDLPI